MLLFPRACERDQGDDKLGCVRASDIHSARPGNDENRYSELSYDAGVARKHTVAVGSNQRPNVSNKQWRFTPIVIMFERSWNLFPVTKPRISGLPNSRRIANIVELSCAWKRDGESEEVRRNSSYLFFFRGSIVRAWMIPVSCTSWRSAIPSGIIWQAFVSAPWAFGSHWINCCTAGSTFIEQVSS